MALLLRGAALPFPNHGHVVLAKPSPILFYPIGSDEVCLRARVCFALQCGQAASRGQADAP